MRRQSVRARKVAQERSEARLQLHAHRGPYCEACPTLRPREEPNPWTDVHEVLTRGRGGSATDTDNQLCLCRPCHHWITVNPAEAEALGFMRARSAAEHRALFRPWELPVESLS
jgi:hypothetical protein